MELTDLKEKFNASLKGLYKKDKYLIETNVNE